MFVGLENIRLLTWVWGHLPQKRPSVPMPSEAETSKKKGRKKYLNARRAKDTDAELGVARLLVKKSDRVDARPMPLRANVTPRSGSRLPRWHCAIIDRAHIECTWCTNVSNSVTFLHLLVRTPLKQALSCALGINVPYSSSRLLRRIWIWINFQERILLVTFCSIISIKLRTFFDHSDCFLAW